jgi:hypothetical protein
MRSESSPFYGQGPRGRRLTKAAGEIYDLSRKFFETPSSGSRRSPLTLAMDMLLDAKVGGDIDAACAFIREHAPDLVDFARTHSAVLRDATPLAPSEFSHSEIKALIRDNPKWFQVPEVGSRLTEIYANRKERSAFFRGLGGVTDAKHRPAPRYDRKALRETLKEQESKARRLKESWDRIANSYSQETILELGQRLYEQLEGKPPKRPTVQDVKEYLAGLGVVVESRDGHRPVTIGDDGWPRAIALACLSKELGQTRRAILAAIRK